MKTAQFMKKALALVLALLMALSVTGCSETETLDKLYSMMGVSVDPAEKLIGSQWVNSDLDGAVTVETKVEPQDDFHTYVNKQWLVEHEVEKGEIISTFDSMQVALEERMGEILLGEGDYTPDEKIMSQQELDHLEDLVVGLIDLAEDEEKRNELGVDPLIPYLEAIENISSLDEMTAYLLNEGDRLFLQETFFTWKVDVPLSTRDTYAVHIMPIGHLLSDDTLNYVYQDTGTYKTLQQYYKLLPPIFEKMGYSKKETIKMIKNVYWFEAGLSSYLPRGTEIEDVLNYQSRADNRYTFEELEQLQGAFPLTTLLESLELDESESFIVYEPGYIKRLGKIYTEKNLETFKDYYLVHTAIEALSYLDAASVKNAEELSAATESEEEESEEEKSENPQPEKPKEEMTEEERVMALAREYVFPNMIDAFQQVYIGRYLSSEMKEDILSLAKDVQSYYKEMLSQTEWLGEETRAEAIKKLENMQIHALYPDKLTDYSSLQYDSYEEGGNLLDAVYAIRKFNAADGQNKVNQPVDRANWDLSQPLSSTLDVNAYYNLMENNVYILAGFVASDFTYDVDAPIEMNLARLGMVIGHEITHAFDTSGYYFDADGLENKWWTNEDEVAFRVRSDKLANHYSNLSYMPGSESGYDGNKIQGEAIADMGGLKCMLGLAKEIPDFDYEAFFTYYAAMFCWKTDLATESLRAGDVHPLGFLRTNVTVQQFDEFYEAFDVQPGDGMYLAPEKRILVW